MEWPDGAEGENCRTRGTPGTAMQRAKGRTVVVSLREFVAHLPARQREVLAAPVRLLPVGLRYGPVYESTRREIVKARTTASWARTTVTARLAQTLRTASRAPYFARDERYAALHDAGRDLPVREVLRGLPILTREEVSAHYREMLAARASSVELSASSGTSGDPIFFLLDRDRGAREWAYVVDAWAPTGYRLGQWRVFFRGLDLPGNQPYFVMASTGEIVIRIQTLDSGTVREYWDLITGRGIEYLHGYPSTLAYLARLLEGADFDTSWRHRIRGLLPVSEQYTPVQDEIFRRVFPRAKVSVFYGLSEKTALARADEDHVYHPYPLYGHVELLDASGDPVSIGQRGRVVTTSLDGRGMPLVRYETGDSAELVGHDATGTPLFRDILARRGREGLVRADGGLFSTTSFNVHGEEFECVDRFKLRQEVPGRAVLLVQPSARATAEDLKRFHRLMIRRTENQVELDLELVADLPSTVNGKFTLLDQRIPDAPSTWA